MATKRTITTIEEAGKDALEGAPEDKTPEERIADEDLTLALAEIGESEGRVQCKRTAPKDQVGMAGTYSPQEFSIERLRDEWGGGTYELYFRLPSGQLKTKRVVQILDKRAPIATPDRTAEIIAALQAQKGGDNGAMLTAFLGLMQAQQKSTTDMIVAMITAQGNKAQAGMGPAELVALLGAIESLKGKGGDKAGGSLDELVKVLKIAKELGGDSEGDGILGKLATMAGPLLEKFADRLPAPGAVPVPAARAPVSVSASVVRTEAATPRTVETPAPTDTKTEGDNLNLRLINWLRETLRFVLDKAEKDKDPELYADYVLDNLPEGLTADVILPQLTADDALDKLAFFDGRAATYRDWLEDFRDAVVERIQEAQTIEEARRNARENPPPSPSEVPDPGADPVAVLYDSPNPSNDSET